MNKQSGSEVLKLQWPLMGNGGILIYSEDRSTYTEIDPAYLQHVTVEGVGDLCAYLAAELKIYVMGYINADSKLVLDEVLGGFDYGNECGW
jgi:hypothetical protein